MIIPSHNKATSSTIYFPELIGKWYCSYQEEYRNLRFARYLHPTGWKRWTHWWESQNEMEDAFYKYGQARVEVSEQEYEQEKGYLEEYLKRYYEDAWEDLDKRMSESQ